MKIIFEGNLKETCANGGCKECQTSCQSASKTSIAVTQQPCENDSQI